MSNGQRSRWSSALPGAFGNSASVCRWRRVRGIVYRVQWFGSYRSGRLSDMPDRPSIRKDIHVPVLDARPQRCHLRRIVARPPAHVPARPTAPVCHVWRHRAGARAHRPLGIGNAFVCRLGHAAVPLPVARQGAGLSGLVVCLYRRLRGHRPPTARRSFCPTLAWA